MKFFKQIRKNALFSNLTDKEIEGLFDCLNARIEKKASRDIVIRPGDEIEEICIILEGNLVEFTVKNNGDRTVVSSNVDGDMFGIPQCFTEPRTTGTFVTSATDSLLLFIKADGINAVCEKACPAHKKLVDNLILYLCDCLNEVKCNNSFIVIKGMRKKIARFIYDKYLEQANRAVKLGVDRNGMARYLNVSRPSMSREIINLREAGIFDFRKDFITIKDLDALKRIALED